MPSLGDSAFIFLLALLLFGPKKLPELARQLGKLMGEFRRASNEFRMQMEDELRVSEQAEQQKKIAAMEAAAPANVIAPPEPEHPHLPAAEPYVPEPEAAATPEPLPIASAGDLHLMPPATGLPTPQSPLFPLVTAIPHAEDPNSPEPPPAPERHTNGLNRDQNHDQTVTEASLHG